MIIYNNMFLYNNQPTVLQNGDIVKVDIAAKTISFFRNNAPLSCKFGSEIIYCTGINTGNVTKKIQDISKLTPVMDTNDSVGDMLIFKLSGESEGTKKESK